MNSVFQLARPQCTTQLAAFGSHIQSKAFGNLQNIIPQTAEGTRGKFEHFHIRATGHLPQCPGRHFNRSVIDEPSTILLMAMIFVLEPLANVNHDNSTNDANKYMTFAQKMLENFVNYALSYTVTQQQMELNPSASYVPTTTVQNWYTSFERRLVQNPNFWKT